MPNIVASTHVAQVKRQPRICSKTLRDLARLKVSIYIKQQYQSFPVWDLLLTGWLSGTREPVLTKALQLRWQRGQLKIERSQFQSPPGSDETLLQNIWHIGFVNSWLMTTTSDMLKSCHYVLFVKSGNYFNLPFYIKI